MPKKWYEGVNDIAREVKKPYFGISNVARTVKKGYIGIDNVARLFFQNGIPIGDLEVGTSIYLPVDGVLTEFFIVHHGNPSSDIYDVSCDGTWLLKRKYFYINNSAAGAACARADRPYETWGVHLFLNGTYYNRIDEKVRDVISNVKIPYLQYKRTRDSSTDDYTVELNNWLLGSDGLSTKIFVPSADELANYKKSYLPSTNYATLKYFEDVTAAYAGKYSTTLHALRDDGNTDGGYYVLRTFSYSSTMSSGADTIMCQNDRRGDASFADCMGSQTSAGVRPMFIVPQETLVNPDTFELLP